MFWKDSPVFTGNTNQSSIVAHSITPAINARYVRILPKTWHRHISMRAEFYGCDADIEPVPSPSCQTKFSLKDNQLSVSSEWDSNHRPANAKLYHKAGGGRKGAWSAKRNDVNQWLLVELDEISKITVVVTQGRTDADQWVKTYTLEYSLHGDAFIAYKEGSSAVKAFKGNSDRNTLMGHKLSHPIVARFIRFRPKTWHGHISMRMAVYGCTSGFDIPQPQCGLALGLQSLLIRDSQFSASSDWGNVYIAANARLHCNVGVWSTKVNNAEQWLQVDFRRVVPIDKVATQGRKDVKQWVTSYGLSYSQYGTFWNELPIFTGNTDQSSVVAHSITPTINARYVRILPKTWHGHISMRVEFYGCDADIEPVPLLSCQTKFPLKDQQLSASSEWDSNHRPANAKLHHKAGKGRMGAWSAERNDVNQWLLVDLGNISKITVVVTQGRTDADQWVKTYTFEYSLHGDAGFIAYKAKEGTDVKVFKGNTDRNTLMGHKLSHPIVARFIRFRPKTWHGHISMRMAVYGCTSGFDIPQPKCGLPLGLQSHGIRDSQLSASSEWDYNHRAGNARLYFQAIFAGRTGAWSAKSNNAEQWLQVDFRKVVPIDKVATQGRQDHAQWVTRYGLSYSQDGMFWNELPVFTGNTDQSSVVAHSITPAINARYVRILPKTWHTHISMRAEFYGCDAEIEPVPPPSCQTKFPLKDKQLSASSEWDSNHRPANAKLHHKAGGGRKGAWSAERNDVNQWLLVELDEISKITVVVTQGRTDADQWVKTYTLEYSLHGDAFIAYKEGSSAVKVFRGNTDRNTLMGHKLSHAIVARFIRFRPKTWHGHISMRMAVYGCTSEDTHGN